MGDNESITSKVSLIETEDGKETIKRDRVKNKKKKESKFSFFSQDNENNTSEKDIEKDTEKDTEKDVEKKDGKEQEEEKDIEKNEENNEENITLLGKSDEFMDIPTILKKILNLSWPVIITFILELLPGLTNTIAVGRLGESQLASVSLASMYCNVTGISIGFGIASAMDTLCSQIFGAKNKNKLGVLVQRALWIELILCFPIGILWFFAEPILLLMGQDKEVSELTGTYCQVMIIGLYPLFIYEIQKKFLQAQGIVLPQMYIAIIGNIWNIAANWLFIYGLDFGFVGAPLARSSTHFVLPFLTTIYIYVFKKYEGATEGSFCTKETFQKWGEFLKLGVPGMLMMCLEWWAFEILAIYAGLLGTTQLAVQAIVYNVIMIVFFIPYGISVSASILIGNSLGSGWSKSCARLSRVTISSAAITEILFGAIMIGLRDYIPLIFTKEDEVIELAAKIIPIVACYQVFDGIAIACGGVLRGCGKQNIGAMYNFVGYFLLGLSISAGLAFGTDLGLVGLWLGFGVAIFVSSIIAVFVVLNIDWQNQVELASERVRINISH